MNLTSDFDLYLMPYCMQNDDESRIVYVAAARDFVLW